MLYGTVVILYREDEVLLVRHRKKSRHLTGFYTFPSGETEPYDEDTKATAIREVKEETGLDIDRENLDRLGHYDLTMERKVGKEEVIIDLYSCEEFRGRLKAGLETVPIWAKIQDFISGRYPLPYTSGDFSGDVKNFLRTKIKG